MIRRPLLVIGLIALVACRQEVADLPAPVPLTADSAGFYCQMALLEHEGPKGQIHLEGMPDPLFFSQVRDVIAYLHMPEQSHAVVAVYVQDMARAESWAAPGADTWMRAEDAVYVTGSDKLGGMGAPEFVPFSDEAAARAFIAAHGGAIRRFSDFTAADALAPAGPGVAATDEDDMADRLKALSHSEGH